MLANSSPHAANANAQRNRIRVLLTPIITYSNLKVCRAAALRHPGPAAAGFQTTPQRRLCIIAHTRNGLSIPRSPGPTCYNRSNDPL